MTAAKFLARLYKLALALSAATAHAQPPAPFADDRKIPVDRWEVVSVEPNGKPIDPELLAILTSPSLLQLHPHDVAAAVFAVDSPRALIGLLRSVLRLVPTLHTSGLPDLGRHRHGGWQAHGQREREGKGGSTGEEHHLGTPERDFQEGTNRQLLPLLFMRASEARGARMSGAPFTPERPSCDRGFVFRLFSASSGASVVKIRGGKQAGDARHSHQAMELLGGGRPNVRGLVRAESVPPRRRGLFSQRRR